MKHALWMLWCLPVFATDVFQGQFSQINVSSSDCNELFAVTDYESSLILTGSGGTTAVVHFVDPGQKGFFHHLTMVGNNGGMGDILLDKKFSKNGKDYKFVADGMFSHKFIYLEMQAEVSAAGTKLCTATAEYSGF